MNKAYMIQGNEKKTVERRLIKIIYLIRNLRQLDLLPAKQFIPYFIFFYVTYKNIIQQNYGKNMM